MTDRMTDRMTETMTRPPRNSGRSPRRLMSWMGGLAALAAIVFATPASGQFMSGVIKTVRALRKGFKG